MKRCIGPLAALCALLMAPSLTRRLFAQRAPISPPVRSLVRVDTNVLALTNVRVIDGTGAPARETQTLIVRDGRIAALGVAGSVAVPAGAHVMDLGGKSVIPGLVMVHEHLFYPTGPGIYGNLTESLSRLYLAGGVTSMRTGGNMNGYRELLIAKSTLSPYLTAFPKGMAMERAFVNAGGTLIVGKQADLVVINGNPAQQIGDVRMVELAFRQGLGYDPAVIIESARGRAGLW